MAQWNTREKVAAAISRMSPKVLHWQQSLNHQRTSRIVCPPSLLPVHSYDAKRTWGREMGEAKNGAASNRENVLNGLLLWLPGYRPEYEIPPPEERTSCRHQTRGFWRRCHFGPANLCSPSQSGTFCSARVISIGRLDGHSKHPQRGAENQGSGVVFTALHRVWPLAGLALH